MQVVATSFAFFLYVALTNVINFIVVALFSAVCITSVISYFHRALHSGWGQMYLDTMKPLVARTTNPIDQG